MAKPRVAIRAFTCRRDVAPAAVLAELLKARGCEVEICSVRSFKSVLRFWRPDVVVVNTVSPVEQVRSILPDCKLVLLEGEGLVGEEVSRARYWQQHPDNYHRIDLVLLWGQHQADQVKALNPEFSTDKLHVVGNPKLDLVRFLPKGLAYDPASRRVGVVCRFHNINFFEGYPTVWSLRNERVLKWVTLQARGFYAMVRAVRAVLENTDLAVTMRPHPLERIDSYHRFKHHWFGDELCRRVEIDEGLDLAEWAVGCRALISPTSTSLLEAYLLRVPVINIDGLSGTEDGNRDHAGVAADWQSAGVMPRTVDELVELVTDKLPSVTTNERIEKQLREQSGWGVAKSANLAATDHIMAMIREAPPRNGAIRFPTTLVDAVDRVSFARACRRNPLHPFQHYRRGHHSLSPHLSEMVEQIENGTAGDHVRS